MVVPFERSDDLGLLAALHASCFAQAWDAAALDALLAAPQVFALVDGRKAPRGFVLARVAGDEAEILTLAVAPQARRQGLATALVAAAAAHAYGLGAKAMFLEVAASNRPARALYAKAGFREAGRRKHYYKVAEGFEDALILRGDLPSEAVQSG